MSSLAVDRTQLLRRTLQNGLRIFTEATLKDPSGKNGGTILATAKATLCDVGLLQRQSGALGGSGAATKS